MTYVVTLVDSTPPARADAISYTSVKIEEAAARTGATWTVIDTQTTGPDANPEFPATRDLTTTKATLAEGWYRLTWTVGAESSTPSEPVQNLSQLAGGTRPTIYMVAAKLRARTKVIGGNEVGTFNASTRPTSDEVEELIDEALDEVLGKVQPPESGTEYEKRIRGAVALYTAILVEYSYFPEAVGSGKSPAAGYEALYNKRIKSLIAEGETGKPQGEGGGDSPADAAYTFPTGVTGMVGWGTRW